MSEAFLAFEIDHFYNLEFKCTCLHVLSLFPYPESLCCTPKRTIILWTSFLVYVLLAGKITQESILYCSMYCQKPLINILILFFCFLGVKACLPLNQKFPFSSSCLSLAPLDGLPSRATNLCIFAKSLFDHALPAAIEMV
jgi:hypothetical protein